MMEQIKIYVVSDSIGDTGHRLAEAARAQFGNQKPIEIQRYPFVSEEKLLETILQDCLEDNGILITTLANLELNDYTCKFVQENNIEHIDALNPLVNMIAERTSWRPANEIGMLHHLDREYFSRIEAIEFAVKYDDGKDPNGFLKADLVLLGVSRTSKTPLSIYLAHKGYKVTNLPIVPEAHIPSQLYEVGKGKIVGLMASPEYIRRIRSERVLMLGLSSSSTYNNIDRIREEMLYFNDLIAQLRAPLINIEGKSVEETAQYIEEFILKPQMESDK